MTVVLDSSALLAVLQGEAGSERVLELLPAACISAVNRSEVLTVLQRNGGTLAEAIAQIDGLVKDVRPFDRPQADAAAAMAPSAAPLGIGLGDRACLALAQQLGCPAATAERQWSRLDCGVELLTIR